MFVETPLCSQRDRETLQCQLYLAHAHIELNENEEKESQDEEQEWESAAAEFIVQRLRMIYTEDGNTTVGRGKRHGDGDDNVAGSDISLLPMNDKGIYAEGLFLYLDRPRGGVPVSAEIMAGKVRVRGQ